MLRVDGNFYDSYQDAMYYMYESVPLGGIIIFDDVLSHRNVMRFWKHFKQEQGLVEKLVRIDGHSAWFRKKQEVVLDWKYYRAPQDVNKGDNPRCPPHIVACHPSWPVSVLQHPKQSVTTIYHSSPWEQLWLDNIERWQHGKICAALEQQQPQLRAFMNATCSARTDTAWCLLDDSVHQLWYHTKTGMLSKTKPSTIHHVDSVAKVQPSDATIFSRFEYPDGQIEFIEPLVSHLRHPMMGCGDNNILVTDRSYIVPPSRLKKRQANYYFDGGASSWADGAGGPSLSYFTSVWKRHGIDIDHIEACEGSTSPANFKKTVPAEFVARTHYHQQWISSTPSRTPFIPTIIRNTAKKSDYVLFKLDIDNGPIEKGTVDHLLSDDNDDLEWIDEFLWEHHVDNYIMGRWWGKAVDKTMSIADSYAYFLKLRQKGVRAHSWV